MMWKATLAAGLAALAAPVVHFATAPGPKVEVSAAAWTGQTRTLPAPANGFADPAFQAALQAAARDACTPLNDALRNAEREAACVADVTSGFQASNSAGLAQ